MANNGTIRSNYLNSGPSMKMENKTVFTPVGKDENSSSEKGRKQTVSEKEDIVNKLINHFKDNH